MIAKELSKLTVAEQKQLQEAAVEIRIYTAEWICRLLQWGEVFFTKDYVYQWLNGAVDQSGRESRLDHLLLKD